MRGLTMLHGGIRPSERGTFAALADPAVIDHLRRLGITAVELLPVHAFLQDRALQQRGLRNYWGYNTLGFFAPEPSYLSDGSPNEMRVAVRRLHAAGIEVILDVVYNHTAESDEIGPTLSFRGLDNASYYRLEAGDLRRTRQRHRHRQHAEPVASARAADGDGFAALLGERRSTSTDFASISARRSGRESYGFDPGAGFFDALRQDPVLAGVKLIAEPWDIGPGGYQLGNHPPASPNGTTGSATACAPSGAAIAGQRPEIAARLAGSADLFAQPRPASLGIGQLRRLARRLHAARTPCQLRRASQRRERRRQPRRPSRQLHQQLGRRRGRPTIRRSDAVRAHVKRAMLATVLLRRRHADAAGRRRVRPHPGRQQQRLLPGQRNILARLGHGGVPDGSWR